MSLNDPLPYVHFLMPFFHATTSRVQDFEFEEVYQIMTTSRCLERMLTMISLILDFMMSQYTQYWRQMSPQFQHHHHRLNHSCFYENGNLWNPFSNDALLYVTFYHYLSSLAKNSTKLMKLCVLIEQNSKFMYSKQPFFAMIFLIHNIHFFCSQHSYFVVTINYAFVNL